jgi:hypothetical protein
MIPLVSPALVAAANPHGPANAAAPRRASADAYTAAMRETGPAADQARPSLAPSVPAAFSREAPFGAERPRHQRPGGLVDLRI